MSYILDALKKADAARERGQVPGLNSQSSASAAPAPRTHRSGPPVAAILGSLALLVLAAAAGWWWQTSRPLDAPAPVAATPAPAMAMPAPTPAPAPAPAAPVAAALPAPVLPILAPEPAPPVPRNTLPQGLGTPPAPRSVPAGSSTAPAMAAVSAQPPAPSVRTFAELAPEIRAQLPQVNVSGSTYSSNPAHRMLIANGKVVHEGEEIAPGLKLEAIGPRSAVLNHGGTRYSIGY